MTASKHNLHIRSSAAAQPPKSSARSARAAPTPPSVLFAGHTPDEAWIFFVQSTWLWVPILLVNFPDRFSWRVRGRPFAVWFSPVNAAASWMHWHHYKAHGSRQLFDVLAAGVYVILATCEVWLSWGTGVYTAAEERVPRLGARSRPKESAHAPTCAMPRIPLTRATRMRHACVERRLLPPPPPQVLLVLTCAMLAFIYADVFHEVPFPDSRRGPRAFPPSRAVCHSPSRPPPSPAFSPISCL